MELKERNNKRTIIGIISTLVFHALIILLLFAMGLKYPDPPPPEEGVEMDIGDLLGQGNAMIGEKGGSDAENNIHNITQEENAYITQNSEEVPIASKPIEKPKTPTKPKEEERINPNALFQKGKVNKKTDGGGQGSGEGKGIGEGKGEGGGGTGGDAYGSGASFSLAGRSSKSLGIPPSKTEEVGSIVVTIWVNQSGEVTRAMANARGTTIINRSLWRHCETAATRSKFTANPNAPFEQKGTITYKFKP